MISTTAGSPEFSNLFAVRKTYGKADVSEYSLGANGEKIPNSWLRSWPSHEESQKLCNACMKVGPT